MTKKKNSQIRVLQAALLACLVGTFSSCAGKSDVTDESEAPSLPVSEASLLSDSEITESQNDSSIFADLAPGAEKKEGDEAAAAAATTVDPSAGPFYNAIGGESLGRVAYTLYGDRSFRKQLMEKNAGLSDPKKLSAGQPVYFDFENVKPQPTYLTKDLLARYPSELSDKLKTSAASAQGTVTVQPGETLQMVSERLYGTTRYWTELYLLNHDKISNYDRVPAGLTLAMIEHGAAPVAQKAPAAPAPEAKISEQPVATPEPVQEPVDSQAAPVAQPTMDPIPETPEVTETQAPSSVTPVQEPVSAVSNAAPPSFLETLSDSSNANVRRIVYVLLIVAIGGLAFYFTRPSRKSKIDMLDVTAGSTAPPPRSKLGTKDTTRKSIG